MATTEQDQTVAEVAAEAGEGLFVRRSSGLVRSFSAFDGFIYAVYADSIIAAIALTYAAAYGFNANIPLGIVIICVALVPAFTVYAMLNHLIPRAGGDYVWQSRILGGAWAYLLCFGPVVVGPWFYMAGNVSIGPPLVVAPFFVQLHNLLGATWPLHVASWLVTKHGQFVFYLLYIVFGTLVVGLGLRFYARFQRWSFYIGCAGILTWMVMLLVTTHAAFVSDFNHFLVKEFGWGDGHAYQQILAAARAHGYQPRSLHQTALSETLLVLPVLGYTFLSISWTATVSGEVSGVGSFKRTMRMYLGANFFCMVVTALFALLLINRVSNEFFTASNYIYSNGVTSIPIAPLFSNFLLATSHSPILGLWIVLAFSAWFWIWPTNNLVGTTRFMFAMSFDRMLPSQLSKVSGRTGTPIVALGVSFIGCVIFGWLWFYTSFGTLLLAVPLFITLTFTGTCFAAIFVPYRKATRRLYHASVLSKYRVGPLPLISVLGVLAVAFYLFLIVEYLTNSRYGINGSTGLRFIAGMGIGSVVLYWGFRLFRKRQGIDVTRTYHEIPVD